MEEKIIKDYINGNYRIQFTDRGGEVITPLVENPGRMKFPNSMDVCITKKCDNGCSFCYNNSNINGKHADVEVFKRLIGTFTGAEIALGGGDVFTHPQLEEILYFCKEKEIMVAPTINQNHLKRYKDKILDLFNRDLIQGIDISLVNPNTWDEDTYQEIAKGREEDVVIHVIAGLVNNSYFKVLKDKKVLILGYKDLGRGKGNMPTGFIYRLKAEWLDILRYKCRLIIFDNLAVEQLDIKNILTPEEWNVVYLGEDGNGSMYLDLVDMWCGISSVVEGNLRKEIKITENTTIESLYSQL